ncbi:MAG: hypothetical protein KGZ58_11300 [Ignavibacteriales bacterium]|nr:hypothetical protein [Ignavibacteriales bacterium]
MENNTPQNELDKDLGIGSKIADKSRERFLNRDGTFNVERTGISFFDSLNLYHHLLNLSWLQFHLLIIVSYFAANIFFAFAYLLCGDGALVGATGITFSEKFLEAFFFSVQTIATIGYGGISPHGLAANILVTFEALLGLLGFALATGLLFARFSRPTANIIFSHSGVIAPYKNGTAFMFRIANARKNQLIEVKATLTMSRLETREGKTTRKFYRLSLEREIVVFFPLHWVIVHPIDEKSPLFGITKEQFDNSDPEFFILLTGTDETFSQTVHARSSYRHNEVVWNAKFVDMYNNLESGKISVDMRKLHDIEKA